MLIDCDIHVTYRSIKDLVPFADPHTRELIERSGVAGLSMPTYPGCIRPAGSAATPTTPRRSRPARCSPASPGAAARARPRSVRRRASRWPTRTRRRASPCCRTRGSRRGSRPRTTTGSSTRGCATSRACAARSWCRRSGRRRPRRRSGATGPTGRFAAVFLPGAARIPYGNPVYDPIWAAAGRGRPAGRGPRPLRGRRHVGAAHRRRHARLLHGVPHAQRRLAAGPPRLDPLPRRLRAPSAGAG